MGRFVSFDPILHPMKGLPKCGHIQNIYGASFGSLFESTQTLNPYGYVKNNPVNVTDPWGLISNCDDDCKECYVFCGCELAVCACTQNKCGKITFIGIYWIPPAAPYSLRVFTCGEFFGII